jgi:hypothetical protein
MDFSELQSLYDRIVMGRSIIDLDGQSIIVYDPRPKDRQLADIYYHQIYNKLSVSEIMTNELADLILKNKGIWSDYKEEELKNLISKKSLLLKEIDNLEFQSRKKKFFIHELNNLEAKINILNKHKNTLSSYTIEFMCNMEKYKYLSYLLSYDLYGNKLWSTYHDFESDSDAKKIKIINESFLNNEITESKIRMLSRKDPWRSIWMCAKKTGNLFDHPICNMTDFQRVLINWSLIYDSVYESIDCPSEEIINNDQLLDIWLLNQSEKRKNEDKNKGKDVISKNDKINNANEVAIFVDSIEDAKNVYELNDGSTKELLKTRFAKIRNEGSVIEGHMPDVKLDLQLRKNRIENAHISQSARN